MVLLSAFYVPPSTTACRGDLSEDTPTGRESPPCFVTATNGMVSMLCRTLPVLKSVRSLRFAQAMNDELSLCAFLSFEKDTSLLPRPPGVCLVIVIKPSG